MNIILWDGEAILGVETVETITDINPTDRVFYELVKEYGRWRSGKFKEITDVSDFLKGDTNLTDPEYIKHHNFKTLKNDKV